MLQILYDKNMKFERTESKQRNLGKTYYMPHPFWHNRMGDTKWFKMIKTSEIISFVIVTEVLIFRSSRSQMFFKIGDF